MGLGKTVQVLALLASRHDRQPGDRQPASAFGRGRAPQSRVQLAHGSRTIYPHPAPVGLHRPQPLRAAGARPVGFDVLVTTYGILRRDIVLLKALPFDYAILDEAQAIKNADAQAAKASRLLQARAPPGPDRHPGGKSSGGSLVAV